MSSQSDIIEFVEVSKNYEKFVALQPTTLSVRKGEFLTLLGPSGSGKTTLLNVLSGGIAATSGKILLNGKDITNAPPRERSIGMVFQNYALMPHMSAFDNVAYPLRVRGFSRADIREKVGDALSRVGLSGFENRKPKQLSGGQQQRVGIARCIVYSPDIILMDEPLGALDKNIREQMQREIKLLHENLGTTFVYVTHDQEEALNMSDRICLMSKGDVVQLGTPDELYFAPVSRFAAEFVGDSNLLEGKIDETGGLRLPSGAVFKLPAGHGRGNGRPCEIMLRPERIQIVADGAVGGETTSSCTTASGTVESVSFVGSLMNLSVQVSQGPLLKVKTTSQPLSGRYKRGSAVKLRWSADDVVVLREEG